jgi:hypothetical protein
MRPPAAVLALAGAAALVVSLFLDWFAIKGAYPEGADVGKISFSGWRVFELADVALALIAVAVAIAASGLIRGGDRARPILLLGLLATAIVAVQLVEEPPFLQFFDTTNNFDLSIEEGGWLALGGSLLVTLAGVLQIRINEERRLS